MSVLPQWKNANSGNIPILSITNQRLSRGAKNNRSKKQGLALLKWNKKYSDLFRDILIQLKSLHFMGKGSCTQNITKARIHQEKGILKIAKNKSKDLLNHLYKERSITGCQPTQTNKKKPLHLRGKKRAFFC